MTIYSLDYSDKPLVKDIDNSWIAPTADIVGKVIIETGVNIWFGAVARGDIEPIIVGKDTNIQDMVMLHTGLGFPVVIGEGCTIGHKAIIHGAEVGDNCLIGMGAILMNGAKIGAESIVAAGALVPEGKIFPPRSLIIGAPAKVTRSLTDEELEMLRVSCASYLEQSKRFKRTLKVEQE